MKKKKRKALRLVIGKKKQQHTHRFHNLFHENFSYVSKPTQGYELFCGNLKCNGYYGFGRSE